MTTDKPHTEQSAVTSGPQDVPRPLDILTDVVGFFGLLFFWISLWLAILTPVVMTLMLRQPIEFSLIPSATYLILALFLRAISKAIILRSRVGLVLGFLLSFLLLAFLWTFALWDTDASASQKIQLGSMISVTLLLGFCCLLQVFRKDIAQ
jgi:hypothetical protein